MKNKIIAASLALSMVTTPAFAKEKSLEPTPPALTKANMDLLKKGIYKVNDIKVIIGHSHASLDNMIKKNGKLNASSIGGMYSEGYQQFKNARFEYYSDNPKANSRTLNLSEMTFKYPAKKFTFTKYKKAFGKQTAARQVDYNAIAKHYGKLKVIVKKVNKTWYIDSVTSESR